MNYAIQLLQQELYTLNEILKDWSESDKELYSEAYKDRKRKVKQLAEAIKLIES